MCIFLSPPEQPATLADYSPHPEWDRMIIPTWLHAFNTLPLTLTFMHSRCGFHLQTDVSQKTWWLRHEYLLLRSDKKGNKTVCYSTVFPCHLIVIVLENKNVSQKKMKRRPLDKLFSAWKHIRYFKRDLCIISLCVKSNVYFCKGNRKVTMKSSCQNILTTTIKERKLINNETQSFFMIYNPL